jgi:uncharacterized protein YcbX
MTTALGSLASLHRYPVKSMMGEDLNAAPITHPAVFKSAAQHNKGQVGAYASVVQTGTIRIGDTLSVV